MEDKKARILEAARNLFNRQGYAKTSVDDISQMVGMRKSSLYYYFKNKEDLFMSSFKSEWEAQFEVFKKKASEATSAEEKILTYTRETLDYYEKVVIEKNIPVKSLIETRNLYRSFVNDINHAGVKFCQSCIELGQKTGEFCNCDLQEVSKTISLVKFSIQYDQLSQFIHSAPSLEDWDNIRDSILTAISLIIRGIKN